jgi:hypothetical protein
MTAMLVFDRSPEILLRITAGLTTILDTAYLDLRQRRHRAEWITIWPT